MEKIRDRWKALPPWKRGVLCFLLSPLAICMTPFLLLGLVGYFIINDVVMDNP